MISFFLVYQSQLNVRMKTSFSPIELVLNRPILYIVVMFFKCLWFTLSSIFSINVFEFRPIDI